MLGLFGEATEPQLDGGHRPIWLNAGCSCSAANVRLGD